MFYPGCPLDIARPEPGSPCSDLGLECTYGEECCCGVCGASFALFCQEADDATWVWQSSFGPCTTESCGK
jgi:hypothetical protein